MLGSQNTNVESEFYAFLKKVLANPDILKGNPGELKTILNKLRTLNDPAKIQIILKGLQFIAKNNSQVQVNTISMIAEIERSIIEIARMNSNDRSKVLRELSNETYANKQRTANKAFNAMDAYIRG